MMTENERLIAKPLTLKIIQAGVDADFTTLARESPLESYGEEQLRLLNALYPSGQPQAGALLKLVE
jgi:Putative Zn-dependent protease